MLDQILIGSPVPDTRIVRSQSTGLRSGEELPERAGGGRVGGGCGRRQQQAHNPRAGAKAGSW